MNSDDPPPPPTDPEILARLDGAADADARRAEAIDIACAMPGFDLGKLPASTRWRLLECLADASYFPPKGQPIEDRVQLLLRQQKALGRLYVSLPLSAEFMSAERALIGRVADRLLANPLLHRALGGGWAGMTTMERLDLVKGVLDAHAREGGFAPPAHVQLRLDPMGDTGGLTIAAFRPEDRVLEINVASEGVWEDLPSLMGVLIHENTHNRQNQLARPDAKGPLAADWRLLAVNNSEYGHVDSDKDYAGYYRQPLEIHARAMQSQLGLCFTRALFARAGADLKAGARAVAEGKRPHARRPRP